MSSAQKSVCHTFNVIEVFTVVVLILHSCFLFVFETGSCYVAQVT
jgi:hypothetical protein